MTPSRSLFGKLILTFFLLLSLIGVSYMLITDYYANTLFLETNQRLHYNLADHLVEEKFKNESPFLENGEPNSDLFGNIMHEMMAVNRNIEVYLLDTLGLVQYCVVLEKFEYQKNTIKVDLEPINEFIGQKDQTSGNFKIIKGDDPRDPGTRKIFSATRFEKDGREGFIYIVLTGKNVAATQANLQADYFLKAGGRALLLTLGAALILGALLIWYLTRNIRTILNGMEAFRQGNYKERIELKSSGEFSYMADQFNHMADTIEENIQQIQAAEKMRRELIANISHDLRTPLSIIYGYAETLQLKGSSLPEEDRKSFTDSILNNAAKLRKLVNELFDLSKLEAKQIELNKAPVYVNELIEDVIGGYQILANKKDISIKAETDLQGKQVMVLADPNLLDRVLQNLLDNAIKFTPEGGIIKVSALLREGKVAIGVQDSGPGIAQEEIPHLFNRYYTRKKMDGKEGTGLGLTIARHIVELHNAKFLIKSELNKGAAFSFELPLHIA